MLNVPRLAVHDGTVMRFLTIDDILYCTADGSYTNIYLDGGDRIVLSRNLKNVADRLPKNYFVRVHQSCVINLFHVMEYKNGSFSVVLMRNQEEISVSRNRKAFFLNRFTKI